MKQKGFTKKELITYLIIIVAIILIRIFIVTPVRVNGSSMDPTLKDGEIMILNKIGYKVSDIKRFDIVVIDIDDERLIKRVIGLPGDVIEYKDNFLYVNNKKIEETFKHKKTEDFSLKDIGIEKVPDNEYFVLGDNRTNSVDSRILGCFSKKSILGKTSLVLFPFSKLGFKK